jgi:gamma-glutamyltranspeptidase/glutathione hydrolase
MARPAPVAQQKVEVLGSEGVVAASSPAIAFAGLRVLAEGGNAIDATLAMAAVGWMVMPGQCGIGGDAFALVREPDGRVWTVNGSGYGPDGGTGDFYRSRGHATLPLTGALAVTTPGALAAITTLHRGGATRPLIDLWRPAIALGNNGVPTTVKTRNDIAEYAAELARDAGTSRAFLPGGRPPRVGQKIYQPELAELITAAAQDPAAFYTGSFAERAVAALAAGGAPWSGEEWAACSHVPVQRAISMPYGAGIIHQTPPPSAGWMVLQQAALCDRRLASYDLLGVDAVHWLAEAARAAFRDRFAFCASDNDGWRATLRPDAIAAHRRRIAGGRHPAAMTANVPGDTTSTVCVDAEGRAVSFIHSLAFTFGGRISVPGTGVVLNNRLSRGAYLIEGHPNEVAPRRKPLHTLNAWVVDSPDRGLLHAGSCPGGDGQVQWNMQVISHLMDHGVGTQDAVALPRVTVFPGSDADVVGRSEELRCEPGLAEETLQRLRDRGHRVVPVPLQVGGPGGSAMVASLDHDHGVMRAGADPRMEGTALAL